MKKIWILLALLFLSNCTNLTEDFLIGKWSYNMSTMSYFEFTEDTILIYENAEVIDSSTYELTEVSGDEGVLLLSNGAEVKVVRAAQYLHLYLFGDSPLYLTKMD